MRLRVKVSVAYWWRLYVLGVKCMCLLTGREPDPVQVKKWARRAVRVKALCVEQDD